MVVRTLDQVLADIHRNKSLNAHYRNKVYMRVCGGCGNTFKSTLLDSCPVCHRATSYTERLHEKLK